MKHVIKHVTRNLKLNQCYRNKWMCADIDDIVPGSDVIVVCYFCTINKDAFV